MIYKSYIWRAFLMPTIRLYFLSAMDQIKNILVLILLTFRLFHSAEIQKASEMVLNGCRLVEFSSGPTKNASVGTPHNKKKVRISSSLQERKIKHKVFFCNNIQKYALQAILLKQNQCICYLKETSIFIWNLYSSLYRFNPF